MKNALLPMLLLALFAACEKETAETTTSQVAEQQAESRSSGDQITLCHQTGNSWNVITVNQNALEAHLNHGDVQLIDGDGDGYVSSANQCVPGGDCNDNDAAIYPGAQELCDNVDNDCDGQTDEGLPTQTYYADADEDGYGDSGSTLTSCSQPEGYVAQGGDCDDNPATGATVHPGAEEICGDGIDQDCDGETDEDCGCPEIANLHLVTLPDGSCLYVHPTDNNTGISWGGGGTDIPGLDNKITAAAANADFDGEANTQSIVNALGGGVYTAKVCADLVAYGYDDWYLPAAGELNEIYLQLGPVGSGQITTGQYWSSSEYDFGLAWSHIFSDGTQFNFNKAIPFQCRCVRR